MDAPVFTDPVEEAKYWREKAEEYRQGMEEAREELEDFQISSRELELELETQVEQLEKRNSELVILTDKIMNERDQYRHRVENSQDFINHEITRLQDELEKAKVEKDKLNRYVRELEQINDDLERTKRATVVTLEDFESRLNQAIERNAFLENELDEKEDLIVTVQRLKEETRDLHQELAITRRQPESQPNGINGTASTNSKSNSPNRTSQERMVQTDNSCFFNSFFTPSVRISALNMVNDALIKIGQLETKLSTLYRAYGTPPLSAPPHGTVPLSLPYDSVKLNGTDSRKMDFQRHFTSQTWTNGSMPMDHSTLESASRESPVRVVH